MKIEYPNYNDKADEKSFVNHLQNIFNLQPQSKFVVYDGDIDISQGEINYIYGMSGSGKTSIFNELKSQYGKDCVDIGSIRPSKKPLVDDLGKDMEKNLKLLSRVGLCEVANYINPYSSLSAGQQFRYKLLKALISKKKYILCDEFCSTLDKTTSKIVCYNLAKIFKDFGKTLILFGVHTHFVNELQPVFFKKHFGSKLEKITQVVPENPEKFELYDKLEFGVGDIKDYNQLKIFHYVNHNLTFQRAIYKLSYEGLTIGVICFCFPSLMLKGRNECSPKYKTAGGKVVNKEVVNISRIIIHPTFRGIGLSTILLKKGIELFYKEHPDTRLIELISTMSHFNPFAGKIMNKCMTPYTNKEIERIKRYGFDESMTKAEIEKVVEEGKDDPKFQKFMKSIMKEDVWVYGKASKKKRTPYQEIKRQLKRSYLEYYYIKVK